MGLSYDFFEVGGPLIMGVSVVRKGARDVYSPPRHPRKVNAGAEATYFQKKPRRLGVSAVISAFPAAV
jgi:hypothetical protein